MGATKDYEAGKRDGRTAATLETLQDSLDRLEARKYPCEAHGELLASLRRAVKYQWALLLLVFPAMISVAALILSSIKGKQ